VHDRWEEEQDMKDVRAILHGIQNGFKRGRQDEEGEVRKASRYFY
jgi:hypothetical protein